MGSSCDGIRYNQHSDQGVEMKTPEQAAFEAYLEEISGSELHLEQEREEAFSAGYEAAQPQWISVKDRLPDEDEVVLVHAECNSTILPKIIELGHWDTLVCKIGMKFITHWMPLPPPPKGEA